MVTFNRKERDLVFKAIADPTRREILGLLTGGPRTVNQIAQNFRTSRPAISKHLRLLRHAGLVRDEKQGKFVVYSLNPDVFRPKESGQPADVLDLGCCRLQLGK